MQVLWSVLLTRLFSGLAMVFPSPLNTVKTDDRCVNDVTAYAHPYPTLINSLTEGPDIASAYQHPYLNIEPYNLLATFL